MLTFKPVVFLLVMICAIMSNILISDIIKQFRLNISNGGEHLIRIIVGTIIFAAMSDYYLIVGN